MLGQQRTHCLHCLTPDASELKIDKKGRPFSYCTVCGTRSFMRTAAGLRGIRLIAPGLVEVYQRHVTQLGAEDAQGDELIRSLQRQRLASVTG